ncbi:acid sphingomyelinase-like phosphodiesterase 3a [Periophthalmus magnuspinnatus]|uniref:acid sphingomyelinase-like phosphodiesterase 3a n=1 Tax=Periophthalmus magnuspinnatus TaxID=409849 RepID=UPI00145BB238|nr:acid sphingomyelinase-like phosphodiesterase 3a [Periophthalmus magnuspinnatus]XP_055088065.1 acid sphingomyelinase-like phosphodiesterase 3a [Periophthalmus magnuspinnatus]XP_055088066.1 acid sphingomyelinase-like phosphodiesterase 3a [Periophthalmus magnuspinnatus]
MVVTAPLTWLVMLLCTVTPLAAAPSWRPHRSSKGRMWHITDLHLDPTYRLGPDPAHVCASSKGSPAVAPGVYGDYLCDAPYSLLSSALDHLSKMVSPEDFVIWTGDSPPHVPPSELSTDLVVQVLSNLTKSISEKLPNVTVYPALGNHDYWPQDQMPDSPNDIYRAVSRLWAPWLQEGALRTFQQGGFYSQVARPGLRIISLNTILYYGPNRVTQNSSDPAGQFTWLLRTLEDAERDREKVYVIAHVPVGFLPFTQNTTAMRREHNERLVAIFLRFSHVISGQFYGHTHRDTIMVLRDQTGAALNSAFVAPSVTPIRNVKEPSSNNPGFRVYLFQLDSYSVQDLWQFYLNLTEANIQQSAQWRLEYVMTEAYGLRNLSPGSLLGLGFSLIPPVSKAFQTYFAHFNVNFNPQLPCEGICKVNQVCAVLHVDQRGYQDCISAGWV